MRDWQMVRIKLLHVETALDELLRQPIEQFRIGRRIAGANVVDRFDQIRGRSGSPTGD